MTYIYIMYTYIYFYIYIHLFIYLYIYIFFSYTYIFIHIFIYLIIHLFNCLIALIVLFVYLLYIHVEKPLAKPTQTSFATSSPGSLSKDLRKKTGRAQSCATTKWSSHVSDMNDMHNIIVMIHFI